MTLKTFMMLALTRRLLHARTLCPGRWFVQLQPPCFQPQPPCFELQLRGCIMQQDTIAASCRLRLHKFSAPIIFSRSACGRCSE